MAVCIGLEAALSRPGVELLLFRCNIMTYVI
jgi:hypothetical protein